MHAKAIMRGRFASSAEEPDFECFHKLHNKGVDRI